MLSLYLQPDRLLELWTIAMKLPNGKLAALSAALSLLANTTSPIPTPAKGVCKILHQPKDSERRICNSALSLKPADCVDRLLNIDSFECLAMA